MSSGRWLESHKEWANVALPLAFMVCLAFIVDLIDGEIDAWRMAGFYFAVGVSLAAAWVVTQRVNRGSRLHAVATVAAAAVGAVLGCGIVLAIAFSA